MPKRVRRSQSDTVALVLKLTKTRPVTPQALAQELGVSGNRARQVLEALRDDDRLEIVGKSQGGRGKPANIYGIPGTKVTPADTARLSKRTPVAMSSAPRSPEGPSEARLIEALLDAVASRGLEIIGPAGITFTVRLGGKKASASVSARRKRKSPGRKSKVAAPAKKAAKPAPKVIARKKGSKVKATKGPAKVPAKATKKARAPRKPAPKAKKPLVKATKARAKKPSGMKAPKVAKVPAPAKARTPKPVAEKKPKLELISPPKKESEAAEKSQATPATEVTPPAPGGGG